MKKNQSSQIEKKAKTKRTLIFLVVFGIVVSIGIGYASYVTWFSPTPCRSITKDEKYASLQRMKANELSQYDGVHDEKVYIGFHCLVYDVTAGKDQYYAQGKGYHYLVGRDATKQLEIFGGDIIEEKYPVVAILTP